MEPSRTIIPSWARQAIELHGRRGQTRRWTTLHSSVQSGRLIVRMSAPAMVGLVVQTLYNLADTVFIGRGVGSLAIVGITTSFPVQILASRRVRPSAFRFEAGIVGSRSRWGAVPGCAPGTGTPIGVSEGEPIHGVPLANGR